MELNKTTIQDWFEYKDGDLFWKKKAAKNTIVGSKCGTIDKDGYIIITLNRQRYRAHQIVFMMFNGYFPQKIDHKNGIPNDNKIENLREATHTENMRNTKIPKTNTSGIKGVCWSKANKKWLVSLKVDGKNKYFGYYYDIEVAKFVCETMRHKYHGKFTNHGN